MLSETLGFISFCECGLTPPPVCRAPNTEMAKFAAATVSKEDTVTGGLSDSHLGNDGEDFYQGIPANINIEPGPG